MTDATTERPAPIADRFEATELGFVRRSDLDTPTRDVWEDPEGRLTVYHKGQKPVFWKLRAP